MGAALWLVGIVVATVIGMNKGRTLAGVLLGAVLGLIGVVIIALIPATADHRRQVALAAGMVECRHCRELVHSGATVCPHCRRDL